MEIDLTIYGQRNYQNLNQNTATGLRSVTESETQTWKIISSNHEKTKSAWALTLTDFDHMHYMNTDKIIVFFFFGFSSLAHQRIVLFL